MKCEGYGEKLDEKLDCKRDGALDFLKDNKKKQCLIF
jgi:hypothetical protein